MNVIITSTATATRRRSEGRRRRPQLAGNPREMTATAADAAALVGAVTSFHSLIRAGGRRMARAPIEQTAADVAA